MTFSFIRRKLDEYASLCLGGVRDAEKFIDWLEESEKNADKAQKLRKLQARSSKV